MQEKLPERKNIRLRDYDYSQAGYYFITICIKDGRELLGNVIDRKVRLTKFGIVAEQNLINIPLHAKDVIIDKYVIMPNHVHMIIVLTDHERTPCMASLQEKPSVGTRYVVPGKSKQTVSRIIQQYKASVSRDLAVSGLWQPRFYDHIIRDKEKYQLIWQYIDENPQKWSEDCYFMP